MGTRKNILHGIVQVLVDFTPIGYTEGGVEIEKTLDIFEKLVDQELDALDVVPTQWSMFVRTSFAETTLENLKLVWNEASSIIPDAGPPKIRTLYLGLRQTIPEHLLTFIGYSPDGLARTYTLWRAKQASSSAHTLQKGDKVIVPVEFRCLPDFDRPIDQVYGKIVDEVL